ncbi:hypothetical protein [Natronoglycomyces albus]|uniref:Uncharacterized protein n=1 Tax=Natronoglycomyces albus TaxID=2811108 RepID=A0A895XKX3_9ACTN|nr:hypothetical protein [Natronoglycomyces albus]QSB05717.1 hypothetical protein JQS30_01960 [Natronoglycomyces albus]
MSKPESPAETTPTFPHRDEQGRVADLQQWLGYVAASVVIGFGLLAIVDVVVSLFNWGTFGNTNGWVSAILAAFLFADDFKHNRFRSSRWSAMALALLLGIAAMIAASLILPPWPPLFAGGAAALVGALTYAWAWFAGVRALGYDIEEKKTS